MIMSHLPLLNPNNDDAKREYVSLVSKILSHSIKNSVDVDESRQILSYLLIHPALTSEDRKLLGLWCHQVEDKFNGRIATVEANNHGQNCTRVGGSLPLIKGMVPERNGIRSMSSSQVNGSVSCDENVDSFITLTQNILSSWRNNETNGSKSASSGHEQQSNGGYCNHKESQADSNSQFKSEKQSHEQLHFSNQTIDQFQNYNGQSHEPSNSNDQLERMKCQMKHPGMKDVPVWLKGLRLHKYFYLFIDMTYEEMMNLTEEILENESVTKGARNKIVTNVKKLRDRQSNIVGLETSLKEEGTSGIRSALNELKSMIGTPIKSFTGSQVAQVASEKNLNNSLNSSVTIKSSGDTSVLTKWLCPSPGPREQTINAFSEPSDVSENCMRFNMFRDVCDSDSNSVTEGDLPGQFTHAMGKSKFAQLIYKMIMIFFFSLYLIN